MINDQKKKKKGSDKQEPFDARQKEEHCWPYEVSGRVGEERHRESMVVILHEHTNALTKDIGSKQARLKVTGGKRE